MGIVGSSSSFTLTRITNTLQRNMLLGSMNQSLRRILELQNQIATGRRINAPSDDPIGANTVMELQHALEKSERYDANVQTGLQKLGLTEVALRSLNDILTEAKILMLQEVNASATPETRRNAAIAVDGMLKEAISIANRKYGNTYLFGGAQTRTAPFELLSGAVAYTGDEIELFTNVSDGISIAINMSGAAAFGALSAEIRGSADLNPIITSETKLRDLSGGEGVAPGSIMVTDGTDTTYIDLSSAESIGDVVDIINNDAAGIVTASINAAQDGLELTTGLGPIGVYEVDGGTTAGDLGIRQETVVPGPLVGADLDPLVKETTAIADLFGGAGLTNPAADLTISNGTKTATINFAGATTVQDMLNIINTCGAGVTARINDSGTGIDVVSNLNGARLSIEDTGGTTASELGLLMGLARTKLADLNDGIGVNTVYGDDLRITRSDGVVVEVDISDATTVQDVIDLINNDSENTGGLLVASVAGTGDRLTLTDNSGGPDALVVENINGSFAASNLGVEGTVANGPAPMVMTGEDLSPAGVQTESIFTALIRLRDALLADDTDAISRSGGMIGAAQERMLNSVAEVGTREQRLELTRNRLEDEKVHLERLLSHTLDVNLAETITKFQNEQIVYQAGLATAAVLLQNSLLNFL